jgi:endonuclease-3 related protein
MDNEKRMKNRLIEIFDRLLEYFGPRFWWPADSPFEVCVGAILTQNTSWGNVEKALYNIKEKNLLSPEALRAIPIEELAQQIRPAGYFNVKSARLKDFIDWLFDGYNGSLGRMFAGDWRDLREELLEVKGIGPETCDSILLYAGHKPSFVVDTYTKRLFSRLGLLGEKASYEEIRGLFMANLPADIQLYNEYHALIVQHCKDFCRKKPLCESCPLNLKCRFYQENRQPPSA